MPAATVSWLETPTKPTRPANSAATRDRSGCSTAQVGHQDSKKLTTAGLPRRPSRVTVRPSNAVTRSAGAGRRLASWTIPGGGNRAWLLRAAARVAAVLAGALGAGGARSGAAQAPTTTVSRART